MEYRTNPTKMEAKDYKSGYYLDSSTAETVEANPPFVQFYKHSLPFVRKLVKLNGTASQVFIFLVENMEGDNAIIVSQQAMSEVLGIAKRTVQYAIKYLQENKYIDVIKSGTTNVYCVNADIVWQQSHDKKKFAKFAARVFVTESEQVAVKKERTVRVKPKRKKSTKTEAA
jgi:DNA-binding transcriptional regulator YhcF (GntR family)